MGRYWTALKKSWKRPVNILVVPHGALSSWKFRVSMPFMLFFLLLWCGITGWAVFIASRQIDYYITKADNKVLHTKIAYIAQEMEEGRNYLAMARQTDSQLREVLGLGSRDAMLDPDGRNGPQYDDSVNFKNIVETKASELSERLFQKNVQSLTAESKSILAGFQEITWYIANQKNVYRGTPAIWPAKGRIASRFGYRLSPFGTMAHEFHSGLDIAGPVDSPIYATADGVVRYADWGYGYGQTILIDHGFGYSTLYGHTTQLLVKPGEQVRRGQMIARMGTTGRSTGIHVHYEVWHNGKPVNPVPYLSNTSADGDRQAEEETILTDASVNKNGG
ncbi:MAG: M23 family metallopeptidase [Elusimicrobiaceae bacterium]|nr:M23 family metallopeptidase [Elusimicrobiaceae bacterium]